MDINKLRLIGKTSYLIASSEKFLSTDEFLDAIALQLENGIEVIELRENNNAKNTIEYGKRIRELCSIYNALFIVYDRIYIAQIIHADGVYIPENGIDIDIAREFLGKNIIIGTKADSEKQIQEIIAKGADFVLYDKTPINTDKIHYFKTIKKLF